MKTHEDGYEVCFGDGFNVSVESAVTEEKIDCACMILLPTRLRLRLLR